MSSDLIARCIISAAKKQPTVAELQARIAELEKELAGAEKRSDERVHQIKMQASMEVRKFKYELWRGLRGDLDDLIGINRTEEDYATPERGKALFRRIQDIIKTLKKHGVVDAK